MARVVLDPGRYVIGIGIRDADHIETKKGGLRDHR